MSESLIRQNPSLNSEYKLANWLISLNRENSVISKIQYHLCGRAALIGTSLLSLIEAVGRAVLGCIAYVGYLIMLSYWQEAKNFGSDQIQKGIYTGCVSLSCLLSILSPKKLSTYLPTPRPTACRSAELLTPEMRSLRIRHGKELIASKLRNQLEHAQNQVAQESDKSFQYLVAPAHFPGHVESERIADYEVGICHFIGRRPTMEDEHLTTSFHLSVGGVVYPVQLFGIFDGHGGGEASRYVGENLERKLYETLHEFCADRLTDEAIWNALKITFVRLKQEFDEPQSGTTATVVMILDGKLWTANVGDSRTILDNGIQLSEDAKPTDARYKRGIENRGGRVFFNRVNGSLAVARAIGDKNVGAVSARPKITVYPLSMLPKESHLILACDGIYDVSSTRQVAAAVRSHKNLSPAELAKNIVYSAYCAESGDNLSALVVKL